MTSKCIKMLDINKSRQSTKNQAKSGDSLVSGYIFGGCQKFLLLFGRIGPLALRPCALFCAWVFLPHSTNTVSSKFHGDMVIWIDMVCLALALAPSCAALHFWCLYIMLSKSYLRRRCDWKDGVFINPHLPLSRCSSTSARLLPKSSCVAALGWNSSNNWNFITSPEPRSFMGVWRSSGRRKGKAS